MRKTTRECVSAFLQGKCRTLKNTSAQHGFLYLFGNQIAQIERDFVYISCAGWNSTTTRERLNGVLDKIGFYNGKHRGFMTSRGTLYFDNQTISPSQIIKIQMVSPFLYEFVPEWPKRNWEMNHDQSENSLQRREAS